jgi:predicted ATPase with chaperone activity
MVGPPGSGKSMLAARLPSILPPLTPAELLEVSMVQSIAGVIEGGALTNRRPFRAPHHSASMPALVGGGACMHGRAKSRSPITVCCFSMSCLNSTALCSRLT